MCLLKAIAMVGIGTIFLLMVLFLVLALCNAIWHGMLSVHDWVTRSPSKKTKLVRLFAVLAAIVSFFVAVARVYNSECP
jgi:hypothetical protein